MTYCIIKPHHTQHVTVRLSNSNSSTKEWLRIRAKMPITLLLPSESHVSPQRLQDNKIPFQILVHVRWCTEAIVYQPVEKK